VSDLPNVDFPTLQITANLPGASPETMASSVATPLGESIQYDRRHRLDDLEQLLGSTSVTIQFTLDRDIDAAAQDVQAAIATALKRLPPEMPSPPSYRKVNPADQPILFLALVSPSLQLSEVNEFAETFLAQRISMVAGVAQVSIYGPQKYAVRVQVDPRELAMRGLGIDEVVNAVRDGNVNQPTGVLQGPNQATTVQATGQLTNAGGYKNLVVAYRHGSPIRLEELANVIDSVENNKIASWYSGTRGNRPRHPKAAGGEHRGRRGRRQKTAAHLSRSDAAGGPDRDPVG
jgi:HAE1 family hydrophobic/amphiphilic exporter-1